MSILEELYYGNIEPSERFVKKESEYHKLPQQVLGLELRLFETVNKDEKALYEQIADLRGQQESIAEKDLFIYAFRLGAQIMLEILTEPETQFE